MMQQFAATAHQMEATYGNETAKLPKDNLPNKLTIETRSWRGGNQKLWGKWCPSDQRSRRSAHLAEASVELLHRGPTSRFWKHIAITP